MGADQQRQWCDEEEEDEEEVGGDVAPRRRFQLECWGSILADTLAAAGTAAAEGAGEGEGEDLSPGSSPGDDTPAGLRHIGHCRPLASKRRSLEEMGGAPPFAGVRVKRRSLDSEEPYGHIPRQPGGVASTRSLGMDGEWGKYGGHGDLVAEPNFWLQRLKVKDTVGDAQEASIAARRESPPREAAAACQGLKKWGPVAMPPQPPQTSSQPPSPAPLVPLTAPEVTPRGAGHRRSSSGGSGLGRFGRALAALRYAPRPTPSGSGLAPGRVTATNRSASQEAGIFSAEAPAASGQSVSVGSATRERLKGWATRAAAVAADGGGRAGGAGGGRAAAVEIPDSWHGEKELRDWVDWQPVESALRPPGLMVAREAMMHNSNAAAAAAAAVGVRH